MAPVKYDQHRKASGYLWQRNGVAKKAITNMRSFVAADGFQVVATSSDTVIREQLQKRLERFWFLNSWDENLGPRVDSLGIDGEWWFIACDPNEMGDVKLCKVLPDNIKGVEADELDSERMAYLCFNKEMTLKQNGQTMKVDKLPIVNRNENGEFEGRVHALQINKLCDQTRGFSDLLPAIDWLDDLSKLLKCEVERFLMQKSLVFDVEVDGDAADEKVIALADQIEEDGPPEPGDLNVHTKSVKWTMQTPDMKLTDSVEFIRFYLNLCCGSINTPPHWFSEGGDVNKATASEMGTPIWAFIRDRKRAIIAFLRQVIRHALWEAREIHKIPEDQLTFSIVSRDPDPSAFEVIGTGLMNFLTTLAGAVQAKLMSQMEARRCWRNVLQGLGLGQLLDPVESKDNTPPEAQASGQQGTQPGDGGGLPDPQQVQEAIGSYFSTTRLDAELQARETEYALAFAP